MKKKLVCLIIMLAAAGAGFYLGWAQRSVPIGSYGVLRSKTHGTYPDPIQEGSVTWIWYRLIPYNTELSVFELNEKQLSLDISGVLPSGEAYSTLIGLKTDFSYSFAGSLSYRIKPSSLPALTDQENLLDQEDLDRYVERLNEEMDKHIRALFWEYSQNERILIEIHETGTIKKLEAEFAVVFPHAQLLGCTVNTIRMPDLILYDEVRRLYRDFIAAQRGDLRGDIALLSAEHLKNRRRLEELSAYGELLSKYPVLLQYLALEQGLPLFSEENK